jgi:hypothetical protein
LERHLGTENKRNFSLECDSMGIPPNEILGFKESESLMAFHNNTPNNTLGIFRFDTKNFKSIFPRNNDLKPNWYKMKCERERRKKQNYISKRGVYKNG